MKKLFITLLLISISLLLNAQLKIHTGGNISLGSTVSPLSGFKIQVVGNTVFTSNSTPTSSSAFIRGLSSFSSTTTPDYTWWGDDQTGLFHPSSSIIGFSICGNERLRIGSSEIVVSTAGDWYRSFYIQALSSNACGYHMRYGTTDNYYVRADGNVFATAYRTLSDSTFKKNIKTISNALEKVVKLRGVTYQYNYSDSMSVFNTEDIHIGVIAQEVQKFVPEVINRQENGILSVEYSNMVGLLIEAIKEQQLQIESLKSVIEYIRDTTTTLNTLKSEIDRITYSPKIDKKANLLYQNAPNPFSQNTSIKYFIDPESQNASICIFDMQGTLIKTHLLSSYGEGSLIITGGEMKPGMYFYTLVVNGNEIATKKMILTD